MSDELVYEPKSLGEAAELSKMLAGGTLLPEVYRNKPSDVLIVMMKGKELGLSTMQALYGMFVIKGKVGMYADTAVGLVKSKSVCLSFEMVESNAQRSVYITQRKGEKPRDFGFTMEMAVKAGFSSANPNYAKSPDAMLRARCSMTLARIVYPDVLAGIYAPEELEDVAAVTFEEARIVAPLSQQMAPAAQAPSRTEALKGQLRNKQLAAKSATLDAEVVPVKPPFIIDVKEGQTDEQAIAEHRAAQQAYNEAMANAKPVAPKEPTPHEAIVELGKAYGKTGKALASIIKGATGKERPSQLNPDDVARVHNALTAVPPDSDRFAE